MVLLAARLTQELEAQFEESARLEEQIRANLKRLDPKGLRDLWGLGDWKRSLKKAINLRN